MQTSTSETTHAAARRKGRSRRNRLAFAWFVPVAGLALLWIFPVRTGLIRSAILFCAVLTWAGALLLWRRSRIGVAFVAGIAALVAVAFVPGRTGDESALRAAYVSSLRGYAGTTYVWGGENHRGIDCSGLVRCALAEATFREGVRTANPRLLREGFHLWWSDASASAMKDGCGGRAEKLFEADALNGIPPGRLEPGDFAVTAGGGHTLAYLGDNAWIAADPGRGGVVTYRAPEPKEHYFTCPMVLLRWKVLDSGGI